MDAATDTHTGVVHRSTREHTGCDVSVTTLGDTGGAS